ncbi:hypothetical protein CR162_18920, partial [Pseudoroseomonas rhizosphaerae]
RPSIALTLTPGEAHDSTACGVLMEERDSDPGILLADRGYDSDAMRQDMRDRGGQPEIPTKRNRRIQHSVQRPLYALRNRIERCINRLELPPRRHTLRPHRQQPPRLCPTRRHPPMDQLCPRDLGAPPCSASRAAQRGAHPVDRRRVAGRDGQDGMAAIEGRRQRGGEAGAAHLPARDAVEQGGEAFALGRPLQGEDAQRPASGLRKRGQRGPLQRGPEIRPGGQAEGAARIADAVAIGANAEGAGRGGVGHPASLPRGARGGEGNGAGPSASPFQPSGPFSPPPGRRGGAAGAARSASPARWRRCRPARRARGR